MPGYYKLLVIISKPNSPRLSKGGPLDRPFLIEDISMNQNMFHVHKYNEKIRLARMPGVPPYEEDMDREHINPDTKGLRIPEDSYVADNDVPHGYSLTVGEPMELTPSEDTSQRRALSIVPLDQTYFRGGKIPPRENFPVRFNLDYHTSLENSLFHLLHHLFDQHNNVIGYNAETSHQDSRHPTTLAPSPSNKEHTRVYTPTRLNNHGDLLHHIPRLFSAFILEHLNRRKTPFMHEMQDYLEDENKGHSPTTSENHLPREEGIDSRYHGLLRAYHPILSNYVAHVLNQDHPLELEQFIDREADDPKMGPGIKHMIKEMLKGEQK